MKVSKEIVHKGYMKYYERVFAVYDIFKDQFGEPNVDLQDVIKEPDEIDIESTGDEETDIISVVNYLCNYIQIYYYVIVVHWTNVRVTNEYGKYTDIKDLWAKVTVNIDGKTMGRFTLNRSNYSLLHFINGYMHSHVDDIPTWNFTEFQSPCTGSGPINNTITTLRNRYDLDFWGLYCCELNNYVTVESIEGVPYHRIENIGGDRTECDYSSFTLRNTSDILSLIDIEFWKTCIRKLIESGKLKYCYTDGSFKLGHSVSEFALLLSNVFIDCYNKSGMIYSLRYLLEREVLLECIYNGGKIYKVTNTSSTDVSMYIGKKVLDFKGKEILLTIEDLNLTIEDLKETENVFYILEKRLVDYVATAIIKIINFRYGKEKETDTSGSSTYYL